MSGGVGAVGLSSPPHATVTTNADINTITITPIPVCRFIITPFCTVTDFLDNWVSVFTQPA